MKVIKDIPKPPIEGVLELDLVSVLVAQQLPLVQPFAWLQTWLSQQSSPTYQTRLMSFHDKLCSDDNPPINFQASRSGDRLLEELVGLNGSQEEMARPMILVCYSFGCSTTQHAVKQMRRPKYNSLFDKIKGIIFVGGIHNYAHKDFESGVTAGITEELSSSKSDKLIKEWDAGGFQNTLEEFFNDTEVHSLEIANLVGEKPPIKSRIRLSKKKAKSFILFDIAQLPPAHNMVQRRQWRELTVNLNHEELRTFPSEGSPQGKAMQKEFERILGNIPFKSGTRVSIPTQGVIGEPANAQSNAPNTTAITTPMATSGDQNTSNILPDTGSGLVQTALSPDSSVGISQNKSSSAGTSRLSCQMIRPYQRNTEFVGRTSALKSLKIGLNPHNDRLEAQVFALIGSGGMGKTQTALAHVFDHWEQYEAILWVQAINATNIRQTYAEFARKLGLVDRTDDQLYAQKELLEWFDRTTSSWLVVFDNADPTEDGADNPAEGDTDHPAKGEGDDSEHLKLLRDFWPTGRAGSILITSQDKRVATNYAQESIKLDPFTIDEAVELLYTVSKIQPSEADKPAVDKFAEEIVKRLESIPFSIRVAAKTILEYELDFEGYLTAFDDDEFFRESEPLYGPSLHYEKTLRTVWAIPYRRLPDGAKDLLNIIVFMKVDDIKETMIANAVKKSQDPLLKFLSHRNFLKHQKKLIISPLVSWNGSLKVMTMHGIVQRSCHFEMEESKQERMKGSKQTAFDRAVLIVSSNWPRPEMHNRRQHSMWMLQEEFIQHVLSIHNYFLRSRNVNSGGSSYPLRGSYNFSELLYLAAWYYIERGFFLSAEPLLNSAKDLCLYHVPDSELLLADIYGGYGAIDSERNKLQETLDHFNKQHEYLMKAFHKGLWRRPDVREALALGGLAQGNAGLDRYDEAEGYYLRCIDAWKDAPGEPTIYKSHYGTCLCFQGKLDEAEKVLQEEIASREKQFGPQDTTSYRTALLYYALENVKRRQGRYPEAYETAKSCLWMFQKTLDEKHHSIADAQYKVAWHQHYLAEYDEAKSSLEQVLGIYESNEDFLPEIARAQYLQASVYEELGNINQGNKLKRDAEELRRKIMGNNYTVGSSEDDYDKLVNFWSR